MVCRFIRLLNLYLGVFSKWTKQGDEVAVRKYYYAPLYRKNKKKTKKIKNKNQIRLYNLVVVYYWSVYFIYIFYNL